MRIALIKCRNAEPAHPSSPLIISMRRVQPIFGVKKLIARSYRLVISVVSPAGFKFAYNISARTSTIMRLSSSFVRRAGSFGWSVTLLREKGGKNKLCSGASKLDNARCPPECWWHDAIPLGSRFSPRIARGESHEGCVSSLRPCERFLLSSFRAFVLVHRYALLFKESEGGIAGSPGIERRRFPRRSD